MQEGNEANKGKEPELESKAEVATTNNSDDVQSYETEEVTDEEANDIAPELIQKAMTDLEAVRQPIPGANHPSVQPADSNFQGLLDTVTALESMNKLAGVLKSSKLCQLKTESDITMAIIMGNQLGFPFMTSITNIYPVNGKPAMSAHLHRALILKHGVFYEKIYDFEPMYQYAEVDDKGQYVMVNNVPVILGVFTTKDAPENGRRGSTIIDRITRYKFTRDVKSPSGKWRELTIYSEFTMSDAKTAGLLVKDNWNNYPARMCDARAFTAGAREIGSDILLGVMSISELADSTNINYTISSNLEETVV